MESQDLQSFPPMSSAARAAIVNRTHRVVRERAAQIEKQKRSRRELVLPLLICSAVLLLVCYAACVVLSGTGVVGVESEIEQTAGRLFTGQIMDTGSPAFLLLLWFLPVSVATVAALFLRRLRRNSRESLQRPLDERFHDEVNR